MTQDVALVFSSVWRMSVVFVCARILCGGLNLISAASPDRLISSACVNSFPPLGFGVPRIECHLGIQVSQTCTHNNLGRLPTDICDGVGRIQITDNRTDSRPAACHAAGWSMVGPGPRVVQPMDGRRCGNWSRWRTNDE